jgi:endonuclease YncB( thermonuclease family)
MKYLTVILFALSAPMLASAQAGEILNGSVQAVDGAHLRISGRTVRLAGIITPKLKTRCLWKGKTLRDCGRMARAAVSDLTAAAHVTCEKDARLGGWRCLSDGYDISEGLIHAGWARPLRGAPPAWFTQETRAREKRLMLWAAKTPDGKDFMHFLARTTSRSR